MPRDIPVGNGSLLVNFDDRYHLRGLYWPYVGQENHTDGHPFRFGVWVEGAFRWVHADGWERELDYDGNTLVTLVTLYHEALQLRLVCRDVVDFHEDLYLRQITVHNEADSEREIRLFFAQDFRIYGRTVGDTAYYGPEHRCIFHYKGKRWFMINTAKEGADEKCTLGIDQWAVGIKKLRGKEGTWRDAEDGELSGNAVAQGSVDSAIGLHLTVPPHDQAKAWYWIAVGEKFQSVTAINRQVQQKGPATFLTRTTDYWKLWINKEGYDLSPLPSPLLRLYEQSLGILRTQIDNRGAIIAANDYDIIHYGHDTYSYMWPRDGALVASALTEAGYCEIVRRFFDFCHDSITAEGYLLHKYNPDGSLGSTWHGWYYEGSEQLPIQEDETALVLWALWRHFERFRDIEFIKRHYRGLVVRAADWMVNYRDQDTGLPLPSWDLWEERRGVHAWTIGTVWGGLQAAANFCEAFGETALADRYRHTAKEIRSATREYLWSEERGHYLRTIRRTGDDGEWQADEHIDASIIGLWAFGMFAADDPRIVATMEAMRERLWIKTRVGGMARYENDPYHQWSKDIENVPGNPWFICTLWLAQWDIAVAESDDDLDEALEILRWAVDHALNSGVMAEQVHPYTNAPMSVSPLTWSHSTLVTTVLEYAKKHSAMDI